MKDVIECLALREIPTNAGYITIFTCLTLSATLSIILATMLGVRFYRGTAIHQNVKILIYLLLGYGITFNLMFDMTFRNSCESIDALLLLRHKLFYKTLKSFGRALRHVHVDFGIWTVFFRILLIFHMYHLARSDTPCSLLFYTLECSWSFYPLTTCIIGFILIQAAFAAERITATCRLGRYERRGKYLGPIMAAAVLILSILCVRWGLDTTDPNELQYQCAGIPVSTKERMISIYSVMFVIDVSSVAAFAYCFYYNKKKLHSGRFQLDLRYEIQENLKVIRILLPVVVAHFLFFGFFIAGSIFIRQIRLRMSAKAYGIAVLGIYIIPHYILVMCALIYGILRQESRANSKFRKAIAQRPAAKQEGETYFDSLRKQWSEKL
ncbi:hypothetical protein Y032_0518g2823 [Ancylostoma ceylanicum]|uniref:G-protein coupled receptors family 1 profile domain-containing protein n=1 Tax=Ancylostoma ceylanicum TaxID=53326 RepID=A0A016WUT0_9BILA|nr:hypothetical protein Y032_0518g2823 [Ancylostoma ceylanicum]